MTRFDVVVIGAGLGGLTAAAILARAGRKVLVIERSNSVGGAASSYKVGDLFVEGSLHETSNPHDARDPKHDALSRAGVRDAVQWIPAGSLYEVRGGPFAEPLVLPDDFAAARQAMIARFPDSRAGITQALDEMARAASGDAPGDGDTLADKLDRMFGDNEAVKFAIAANLPYYHDDPAELSWRYFASAQGSYLQSGGRFVQGGSQRLSSALARSVRKAGGEVLVRRVVSAVSVKPGEASVSHTARDGSDPQTVDAGLVISNAAPATLAALLPERDAAAISESYAHRQPSISLFALTLGLAKPPGAFGVSSYSTQLLPDWMTRLSDFAQAAALLGSEPAERMPPLSVVDYTAIDSGLPSPPHVLSVVGPDRLANWSALDPDDYRARRGRWQDAIVAHLDRHYPGLADAVTASSFNTAQSVQQYLNAPDGAVYGFAPTPDGPARSPRTVIPGLYLSSAYGGYGGYSGVIETAAACADIILNET